MGIYFGFDSFRFCFLWLFVSVFFLFFFSVSAWCPWKGIRPWLKSRACRRLPIADWLRLTLHRMLIILAYSVCPFCSKYCSLNDDVMLFRFCFLSSFWYSKLLVIVFRVYFGQAKPHYHHLDLRTFDLRFCKFLFVFSNALQFLLICILFSKWHWLFYEYVGWFYAKMFQLAVLNLKTLMMFFFAPLHLFTVRSILYCIRKFRA